MSFLYYQPYGLQHFRTFVNYLRCHNLPDVPSKLLQNDEEEEKEANLGIKESGGATSADRNFL